MSKQAWVFALVVALTAPLAQATIVAGPISVPALETPGTDPFGTGFTNYQGIDNWYEDQTGSNWSTLQDETNSTVPDAQEGQYWVNVNSESTDPAGVYQLLGTWNTGNPTQFDVSFDLGDRSSHLFGDLTLYLVATSAGFTPADGTKLSTDASHAILDQTATFTDGDAGWVAVSGGRVQQGLTDSLLATGVSDGQKLWIQIEDSITGTQSLVDNLSVTAIPEPATLGLLGLAGMAFVLRRRRG